MANLQRGVWKAVCAVCGFEFDSNELKQRWDGVYVCDADWEPRNILDFFKVRKEDLSVPWVQKDTDTISNYVSIDDTDSPYTATSDINVIDVDATSGNVSILLPLAADYTFAQEEQIHIRRTDDSSNTVTVDRQGADTIDGTTSVTIPINGFRKFDNDASTTWRTV